MKKLYATLIRAMIAFVLFNLCFVVNFYLLGQVPDSGNTAQSVLEESFAIFDRFGEEHSLSDFQRLSGFNPPGSTCMTTNGLFELTFVNDGIPDGFHAFGSVGQTRRNLVKQVFEDLSVLIIPAIPVCIPSPQPRVRIAIRRIDQSPTGNTH